nr:helix-turn-helix transcriptional regulator [Nocardia sp. BMG51109]
MHAVRHHRTEGLSVGERVELRRMQFGLSRKVVANLVGRSEEWLRLVESGRAELDSIKVVLRLAEVLQIEDFRDLIDRPVRRVPPSVGVSDLTDELQQAILDHPVTDGRAVPPNTDGPAGRQSEDPAAEEVMADLARCEQIWLGSRQRFSQLAKRLPDVVTSARRMSWRTDGAEGRDSLVRSYQLCRSLLTGTGAHGLAWVVADRAVATVRREDPPAVLAASLWHLANALLYQGQLSACHTQALAIAGLLSEADQRSPDHRLLCGAAYLVAAKAAAGAPDPAEADRLLTSAQFEADRLGGCRSTRGIGFGDTEIGLTRMEIALGRNDFDDVIEIAAQTDVGDDQPAGRRARYHIATAAAFAGRNDDVGAAFALAKAAESSPEDLRYDPDAHRTLKLLLQHGNRLLRRDVARLVALADLDGRW